MASIHRTSNWPRHTQLREIDMVIFHEWEERPPVGREIFNVRESSQYQEDTLTAGGIGLLEELQEGQALNYLSTEEGFRQTYTHLDYGNAFRVTRRMLREDKYGTMEELATELALAARATEDTLLANHFNRGFNGSYTGPEGKVLFATDHVREDGGAYSNRLTDHADLAQASLEQANIDFSDFRTGGGRRLVIEPACLVVPKELKFEAHRLIKSTLQSEDDTNAVNAVKDLHDVLVWNYLTDTDAWFLCAAKANHKLLLYDREEFWTDYEYDFDTKDYKCSGMFAQSSGWSDARGVFGTAGV